MSINVLIKIAKNVKGFKKEAYMSYKGKYVQIKRGEIWVGDKLEYKIIRYVNIDKYAPNLFIERHISWD